MSSTNVASPDFSSHAASQAASMSAFVSDKAFPCVGAKSALNKNRMRFLHAGAMDDPHVARRLVEALLDFSAEFQEPGATPVSLVAMFDPLALDENAFETMLWTQLQAMHRHDAALGYAWDASVSSDTARNEFSFSIGGRAYFVVGLHPGASRLARRTPFPCLVFNFHDQFESLKASGKYASMQSAIRARDIALQGTINPVLARFGESSEARQYSGRAVEQAWACPFHAEVQHHA